MFQGLNGLHLGFIGAGNMATAILDGVVSKGLFSPEQIIISNPHAEKLEHPRSLGVQVTFDNAVVAQVSDLIILAVKPQKFEEVLAGICDCCVGKCIVSIAAGISTDWIRTRLPGARVVRVMPNTPLQLGLGSTAVAQAPDVPDDLFQTVCDIFDASGSVAVIPESQMDDVIPVSGSSPAFFFRMADGMVRWASEHGMDPQVALELAASAMKGSAEMLLRSGKTAEELTRQVCSPGGTTLAALTAFDERDFDGLLADAMTRCTRRSRELGK
ncbi:MAG: pyrroline-5-carboxylate reductase [Oscillospiraceae bacterium]